MRFSLRWALAAMAYVALAAAAMAKPSDSFILCLWLVAAGACIYSSLLAVASCGKLRVVAAGFALATPVYSLSIYALPYRTPWYAMFESTAKPGDLQRVAEYQRQLRQWRRLQQPLDPARASFVKRFEADLAQALRLESTNAIGAMVTGLVGCGLGALAYRRGQP